MEKIWLSPPHMGGTEKKFIDEAFYTNWISSVGPNIDGFEKDIENYLDERVFVTALSSGTAALHLALICLGVGPGDEVICPTFTFAASANPIVYLGASPVFIDSEAETWNMDPQLLETAIRDRLDQGRGIKAVIVVHLYGMPARLDEILRVARKYNIPLIEDAAESLGSTFDGKMLGTYGDVAILSFNGNKIITTSGGGALVSSNNKLAERAKFLATQARDNAPHYQHSEIGYNYRMSNICAGIGRGQMEVLPERVRRRREIFAYYKAMFAGLPGVSLQEELDPFYFSNRWLTAVLFSDEERRERIRMALNTMNIESRPVWKPMHLQPVFEKYLCYGGKVSEDYFKRGLCLPSGSSLENNQLDIICREIKKFL